MTVLHDRQAGLHRRVQYSPRRHQEHHCAPHAHAGHQSRQLPQDCPDSQDIPVNRDSPNHSPVQDYRASQSLCAQQTAG